MSLDHIAQVLLEVDSSIQLGTEMGQLARRLRTFVYLRTAPGNKDLSRRKPWLMDLGSNMLLDMLNFVPREIPGQ
jgi:hypothetical protein